MIHQGIGIFDDIDRTLCIDLMASKEASDNIEWVYIDGVINFIIESSKFKHLTLHYHGDGTVGIIGLNSDNINDFNKEDYILYEISEHEYSDFYDILRNKFGALI